MIEYKAGTNPHVKEASFGFYSNVEEGKQLVFRMGKHSIYTNFTALAEKETYVIEKSVSCLDSILFEIGPDGTENEIFLCRSNYIDSIYQAWYKFSTPIEERRIIATKWLNGEDPNVLFTRTYFSGNTCIINLSKIPNGEYTLSGISCNSSFTTKLILTD